MPTWKKVIVSGSDAQLNTLTSSATTIGNPEDSTYTDGLYTDFTILTPVGVAVDRFNTILKGLSPAAAPNLTDLETSNVGSNNLSLAFGASQSTASYSNVIGTGSLGSVNFTSTFSTSTGAGGSYVRLGTFNNPVSITGTLNKSVASNGSPFVNYPANSFNTPLTGGETYTLEVNGTYSGETTTSTTSLVGTIFTLSSAQTGSFPSTGQSFPIFVHRTGTITIPTSYWRNGWNYAKVTDSTGKITNYIDWVYDPQASPGNSNYTFTSFITGSVTPTGTKYLSGIQYYKSFSYNVTGTVGNYFKNTYQTTALSFGNLSSNLSAATTTIPTPTTADSTISINSTHTLAASGVRLLNGTLTSTLTITNVFGKTGNTGAITTPGILLDNNDTSNTTIQENFCLENYRISSGSYNLQTDVSSGIATFPSDSVLGTSELAVYNGAVRYPTQLLNGGNISGQNIVYAYGSQPNYSGASQNRYYFRGFQNGSNARATFSLGITGTNINFTANGGSLTGNNVMIWIKVPESTGWRDVMTSAPGSTSGIVLNDNVGCLTGAAPSNITTSATAIIGIDLKTEGMTPSQYFVVRIETSSGWTGTISQINITGL